MKTKLSTRTLMLLAFTAIIMVSCKKDTLTPSGSGTLPGDNTNSSTVGNIVDHGAINSDVRLMKADLNTQDYTSTGTDGYMTGSTNQVAVAFYVNADGFIPTGEYAFSETPDKAPFTFDSGAILTINPNDSYGLQTDQIVGGKITVQQDGDNYIFSLQVNLASGSFFNGTYNGKVGYTDSY